MNRENPAEAGPLRYVRYGRMSNEHENPRSVDQQFESIRLSMQMQNRFGWTHVADFRDDGFSGGDPLLRPALRQLLEGIRSGQLKIDAVHVDSLERMARSEKLQAVLDELRRHGVTVLISDFRRS